MYAEVVIAAARRTRERIARPGGDPDGILPELDRLLAAAFSASSGAELDKLAIEVLDLLDRSGEPIGQESGGQWTGPNGMTVTDDLFVNPTMAEMDEYDAGPESDEPATSAEPAVHHRQTKYSPGLTTDRHRRVWLARCGPVLLLRGPSVRWGRRAATALIIVARATSHRTPGRLGT